MARQLNVRTVADALVDALRERILSEQLPGGTALTELEVSVEYDVARPTAKTAIERLVTEGLLTRDAHRSARVLLLDADDVDDLYVSRTCMEESALRRLAARSFVPPAARQSLDTMVTAFETNSTVQFVDADIEFHRHLVDAVGAAKLSKAHGHLLTETRLCMTQVQMHLLLPPEQILGEHREILAAIEAGDPDLTAKLINNHLGCAQHVLAAHLREISEEASA